MRQLVSLLSLLLLLALPAVAQHNAVNPDGPNVFRYPDGTVSSEGPMRGGQPDGYWKTYYPSGRLKSEGNRVDYRLDGPWIFFAENGDTSQVVSYRAGKKNGYTLGYQATDSLRGRRNLPSSRELFLDDVQQGTSFYYHPDGSLRERVPYQNGQREGLGWEHAPDGRVVSVLTYRHGRMVARENINRFDDQGRKQGLWKEFHENGTASLEASYRDGQLHGPWRRLDSRGNVLESQLYQEGLLIEAQPDEDPKVEIRERFHPNGQMASSGGYREGRPVGVHREFDAQGQVVAATTFDTLGAPAARGVVDLAGKPQGEWTYFHPGTEQPRAVGRYENGKRNGDWKFYYPGGTLEQSGGYGGGLETGTWKWFSPEGKLIREESFYRGKEDGRSVEYGPDGQVLVEGEYIEGYREGLWSYHVGDHSEQGEYRNGLRHGIWKHYYADGSLRFEGEYMMGGEAGVHREFYPGGNLKWQGEYSGGRRHGLWSFYDPQGTLSMTITYELGKEVRIDGKKVEN